MIRVVMVVASSRGGGAAHVRDLSLERLAVTHKGAFFTELFGLEIVLKH